MSSSSDREGRVHGGVGLPAGRSPSSIRDHSAARAHCAADGCDDGKLENGALESLRGSKLIDQ
jgi:hypothetical protein